MNTPFLKRGQKIFVPDNAGNKAAHVADYRDTEADFNRDRPRQNFKQSTNQLGQRVTAKTHPQHRPERTAPKRKPEWSHDDYLATLKGKVILLVFTQSGLPRYYRVAQVDRFTMLVEPLIPMGGFKFELAATDGQVLLFKHVIASIYHEAAAEIVPVAGTAEIADGRPLDSGDDA